MSTTRRLSELILQPLESKSTDVLRTPQDYILLDTRPRQEEKEVRQSKINFYVLGCGGNGQKSQKDVAELMNKIAALPDHSKPKFIIILGDNFYDNGVDSATDPAFEEIFYSIYQDSKLTTIAKIPCFIIPGNHDHNIHYRGTRGGKVDFKKIASQINHTFLQSHVEPGENKRIYQESEERMKMYQEEKLDLANLPKWNMPRRYYSCVIKGDMEQRENDLEMFFVDSSTYVKDFLNSREIEAKNPNNQANWLGRVAKNRNLYSMKLIFMHHPLYAVDKRLSYSDAEHYLSKEDIKKLNSLGFNGNYNDMLCAILRFQGLKFDATFAAHTHAMSYYYNEEKDHGLCQVISGGGGGDLSDRYHFSNRKTLPCFVKNYGFVDVSLDLQDSFYNLSFDYYSVDQLHLKFTNKSAGFVRDRDAKEENRAVVLLREIVTEACESYYDFLASPPKIGTMAWFTRGISHNSTGSQRADDLINFFNRYEPVTFTEAVDFLKDKMQRLSTPDANSLVTYLSESMFNRCQLTYADFTKRPELFLSAANEMMASPVIARSTSRMIPMRKFSSPRESADSSVLGTSPWQMLSPKFKKTNAPSPSDRRENKMTP